MNRALDDQMLIYIGLSRMYFLFYHHCNTIGRFSQDSVTRQVRVHYPTRSYKADYFPTEHVLPDYAF